VKFGTPTQNEMPMTIGMLKFKPKVEFQHGGVRFSENGSSYNSAVAWDIFTKFGTLRDRELLRTCALPNWNRKLIRDVNCCQLENINVTTTPHTVRFIKKSKPEVILKYLRLRFFCDYVFVYFYKTVNRFCDNAIIYSCKINSVEKLQI